MHPTRRWSSAAVVVLSVLGFSACAGGAKTKALSQPASKVTSRNSSAALKHVSIVVRGTGPDVLLIPGLASSREVWDETVEAFSSTHRLHVVQIRGFGDAPGANADGSVLDPVVAELARYIRGEGLAKPAVVGHSVGGLIAMMLAIEDPELLGRALIIDTLPFVGLIFDPNATLESVSAQADAMRDRMGGGTRATGAMFPTMSASVEGRQQVADWANVSDPRVTGQLFHDAMQTDIRPDLVKIRIPMTVLYPSDGSQGTLQQVNALYAGAFTDARTVRLVCVDNSRHFITIDQPRVFVSEMRKFLTE